MKKILGRQYPLPFFYIFFILISLFLSLFLGKDINWDLKNYHFYNGYAFANSISFFKHINPGQLQTFHNPTMDLPLYYLISKFPPIFTGIVLGILQGINFCLVFRILVLILEYFKLVQNNNNIAFAATLSCYYSAMQFTETGTTFGDNITSIFILISVYLVLKLISYKEDYHLKKIWLVVIAGYISGIATGLKLTSAIYAIALGCTFLFLNRTFYTKIQYLLSFGIACFLGFLTSIGHWMWTLYKNFGNPLFPYFNNIFKSPFYIFQAIKDDRFLPKTIEETLFYPYYFAVSTHKLYVCEVFFRDFRMAVLLTFFYILLIVFIIKLFTKKKITTHLNIIQKDIIAFLFVLLVVSYGLWLKLFSIYRYFIPVEFLFPAFILISIYLLFESRVKILTGFFAILALVVFTTKASNWGRQKWFTKTYFEVKSPLNIKSPSNIIVASNEPLSYIIPSFPENIDFVRVLSNLTNPWDETKLQEIAMKKIRSKENNFLLVYPKENIDYKKILSKYSLKIDSSNTFPLTSNIDKGIVIFRLKNESD